MICKRCDQPYTLLPGHEPTGYCHDCAQEILANVANMIMGGGRVRTAEERIEVKNAALRGVLEWCQAEGPCWELDADKIKKALDA